MNHIELFTGCGGLALGLVKADFKLLMANELSPMAAQTFVYNFFNEDLEKLAREEENGENVKLLHTLWLSSKYNSLKDRLKENPFEYPAIENGFSDIPDSAKNLCGKMIVGSIVTLNKHLRENPKFCDELNSVFAEKGGLDVVTGGPPCQGFSLAGKRIKDDHKNSLPMEFINFVNITRPKVALLENVSGILRPFLDDNGNSHYAWYEVAKGFASIGYIPLCLHLNARHVGVAQNRPRFFMISVREDVLKAIDRTSTASNNLLLRSTYELFSQSVSFFEKITNTGLELEYGHLDFIDATIADGAKKLKGTIFENLATSKDRSVYKAIRDLASNSEKMSTYVKAINKLFRIRDNVSKIENHELRKHSPQVERRFRIYQILRDIDDNSVTKNVLRILRGQAQELSEDAWKKLSDCRFLLEHGEDDFFNEKKELENFLQQHSTQKHSQKSLVKDKPAPTALTIPDDVCHYDSNQLRVLTVREMARIQSFPDSFIFKSKITTGGDLRKFEVPQYTQVGNAVPPLFGYQIGKSLKKLLSAISG